MVVGGVMLGHSVLSMGRRFMEGGRPLVLEGRTVVLMIIWVGRLVLVARMRVLCGIVDIVVRCYSVVARQCASNAWVPPERTALAGRRALNGKNLMG